MIHAINNNLHARVRKNKRVDKPVKACYNYNESKKQNKNTNNHEKDIAMNVDKLVTVQIKTMTAVEHYSQFNATHAYFPLPLPRTVYRNSNGPLFNKTAVSILGG